MHLIVQVITKIGKKAKSYLMLRGLSLYFSILDGNEVSFCLKHG